MPTYYKCKCGRMWKIIRHDKEMWQETFPIASIPEGKKIHPDLCGECSQKALDRAMRESQKPLMRELNKALVGNPKRKC